MAFLKGNRRKSNCRTQLVGAVSDRGSLSMWCGAGPRWWVKSEVSSKAGGDLFAFPNAVTPIGLSANGADVFLAPCFGPA